MRTRSLNFLIMVALLAAPFFGGVAIAKPTHKVLRTMPTHRQRVMTRLRLHGSPTTVRKVGVRQADGKNVLLVASPRLKQLAIAITGKRSRDVEILNTPAAIKDHGMVTPHQALYIAKHASGVFGPMKGAGKTKFRGASEDGRAYKFETKLTVPFDKLEGPNGHGKRVYTVVQYVNPLSGASTAAVGKHDRLPAGSIPIPN